MGELTHEVSGEVAMFRSADKAEIKSLKVNFSPVQEGTGDPSPTNIRPITGWTGMTVYQAPKNLLPKTWFSDSIKGTFGTDSSSISAATNGRCASIYVGKNRTLYFNKSASNTIMFAFTDKHLVDRTATIYDAVNCANRTGLTMNSGDHPWLVINTSNPNVMYKNIPNVNGILWFAGQPSGYEEQQEWEPINIDWTDEAGSRYGGELDLISGVLTNKWRTIVFDGVNTKATNCRIVRSGSKYTNLIGYYVVDLFDTENNVYNRTASQKMCSHFPWLRYNDRYTAVPGEIYFATTAGQVIWCDPTFTTLEQFNNYLAEQYAAGTPVTISYIRSEQYYTDYQLDPIPLRTLLDRNCVWSNANGETEVEYAFTDRLAKRRMLMQMPQGGLLPGEYQQVEYLSNITATGRENRFIATGIKVNGNQKRVYVTFAMNWNPGSADAMMVSSYLDAGHLQSISPYASACGAVADMTVTPTISKTDIQVKTDFIVTVNPTNRYIKMGGWSDGSWTQGYWYSFRVEEMDGTVLADYIPCYRKSDNKPGMYDLTTATFRPSDGSEDFGVGPEV